MIRALIEARVDPVLFRMSRDYVGDTAETIALLWPGADDGAGEPLSVAHVVDTLNSLSRSDAPAALAAMLDRMDAEERFALLKMATGALRIGVSARLAKTALAQAFGVDGRGGRGGVARASRRPMPSCSTGSKGAASSRPPPTCRCSARSCSRTRSRSCAVDLDDYAAEWKWDGIRVQIVHVAGETRLYSRAGDDITGSFPDVARGVRDAGRARRRADGEGRVPGRRRRASFNALQQRLGRKVVSAKMLADYPAFVRLYDILFDGAEDLRPLPWTERRAAAGGVRRRDSTPTGSTSAR